MIDPDDPKSAYVFAASKQMDVLLGACKKITTMQGGRRCFMLETVRPAFAALRWLNTERFGNVQSTSDAINEFENNADELARLPTSQAIPLASPISCPACGSQLTKPHEYDPMPYCSKCLAIVAGPREKLDWAFGTWRI